MAGGPGGLERACDPGPFPEGPPGHEAPAGVAGGLEGGHRAGILAGWRGGGRGRGLRK